MDASPHVYQWQECLEYASKSDKGLRRYNNQDSHAEDLAGSPEAFETRGHLFLVADGMGAHAAGEAASQKAAEVIPLAYRKSRNGPPEEALRQAFSEANAEIFHRAQSSEDFRGMGTTVSALAILPHVAWVAHVGDSRVYRCRGDRIEQLSKDHSLAWELKQTPGPVPWTHVPKNIITRSLGPQENVEVDIEGPFPIQPGDVFVLCTDGLSGQVSDEEIGQIVRALPAREAVDALVNLANLRGGPDNITVTVVHIKPLASCGDAGAASPGGHTVSSRRVPLYLGMIILAAVLAGLCFLACWQWVRLPLQLSGLAAMLAFFTTVTGAWVSWFVLSRQRQLSVSASLSLRGGTPPYSTADCSYRRETVDALLKTLVEVEEAARENDWPVPWDHFRELKESAVAAQENRLGEAIASACRAICLLMSHAKPAKGSRPSESNTNYYRNLCD